MASALGRKWFPEVLGALVVLVTRLVTMPRTFWENDELLFASAIRQFDPWAWHPHPPGYPLYIGIGKFVDFFVGDPFRSLVAISIAACVIGYVSLSLAFRRYFDDDAVLATAGALTFYFSAAAMIHLTLPLSDSLALMFVAIALLTASYFPGEATERSAIGLGLATAAAIGVRPQLVVPLFPVFLLAILWTRKPKLIGAALIAFTSLCFCWFVPLMEATGGFEKLVRWEMLQAKFVAAHDAGASRSGAAMRSLVAWFVIHPFGAKWLAAPLLVLTILGGIVMLRRWKPVFVVPVMFGVIHAIFALLVMDPADSARYSLPHVMIFCMCITAALAATRDAVRAQWVPLVATGLFAVMSWMFVSPLISARTHTQSPPYAAAQYAIQNFPSNTVIGYDASLRPHAEYLLTRFRIMNVDQALAQFSDQPGVPVVLYVDGGSRMVDDADAREFTWPASEAYKVLTRDFYQKVTLDPVQPAERYRPMTGVYTLERTAQGEQWRWLQREATIDLPGVRGESLHIAFTLPANAPWDHNTVHVLINGAQVATTDVLKGGRAGMRVPLPPTGHVRLTIRSDQTYRPSQVLGNGDTRDVAVQLVSLDTLPRGAK